MKNRINVYGVISPSDWDWEREFVSEYSATFPVQVAEALATADPCQDLELHIDSPGGYVDAGRSMIAMIEDWCQWSRLQRHRWWHGCVHGGRYDGGFQWLHHRPRMLHGDVPCGKDRHLG